MVTIAFQQCSTERISMARMKLGRSAEGAAPAKVSANEAPTRCMYSHSAFCGGISVCVCAEAAAFSALSVFSCALYVHKERIRREYKRIKSNVGVCGASAVNAPCHSSVRGVCVAVCVQSGVSASVAQCSIAVL